MSAFSQPTSPPGFDRPATARNVVLVHGAMVDGSSWRHTYDILVRAGLNVSVVQQPLTSLEDDVAATQRVIDAQDGPTVLVGHSYGGQIITVAGVDPKVTSLVYLAAQQPDIGESIGTLIATMPAPSDCIRTTADGRFLYVAPDRFIEVFCADAPPDEAAFMRAAQMPIAVGAFWGGAKACAWQLKPSYAIVAADDRILSPELQRVMARRAGSIVTELRSSHLVYVSHPEETAALIRVACGGPSA